MSAASEDEYVRLKLELAHARAHTDAARLQARQLLATRDGLREDVTAARAETEEQEHVLAQTRASIEQLKEQIRAAEEEREGLLKRIEGGNEGES